MDRRSFLGALLGVPFFNKLNLLNGSPVTAKLMSAPLALKHAVGISTGRLYPYGDGELTDRRRLDHVYLSQDLIDDVRGWSENINIDPSECTLLCDDDEIDDFEEYDPTETFTVTT